tara:strand:+ start:196 stop:303 length:108 start_codon:yes stop_codon:yes gene_type:complete
MLSKLSPEVIIYLLSLLGLLALIIGLCYREAKKKK